MAKTYARFAASPIGPNLAVQHGGLLLTTSATVTSAVQAARSDVGKSSGTHGVEFMVYGDDPLAGRVGVCQPGSSLSIALGAEATSVGWALASGEIVSGNAIVASGLPVIAKGEVVGVRIDLAANTIAFYRGATLVHSRALPAAGATWHFAASMATPGGAGKLTVAVNAGQWQGLSEAARTGWQPTPPAITPVRLADRDWLAPATDAVPHARYEDMLDLRQLTLASELGFWPWGGEPPTGAGAASLAVVDPAGTLDALAQSDVAGIPVALAITDLDASPSRDTATALARFVLERIEAHDDTRKVLVLRDAHDDLDEPLTRGVFLPNVPSLAWQPQPVVIGAVASVPALRANSDGSVLWLADSPLAEVSAVMDRGDLMEAGTWAQTPDQQQLTLTQPTLGPVVADVSSIGTGMAPATLAQTLEALFRRIGKASWSKADAQAIDTACGYAGIGYYADDAIPVRVALAQLLPSWGAWWWQDGTGLLRFARITAPEAFAGTLAFDLDSTDFGEAVVTRPDDAPNLSRRMGYRPNARPLQPGEFVTDLVDVTPARRNELSGPFRGIAYCGAALAPRYAHADAAAPAPSYLWRSQDAQAELDRVCGLYATTRQFYLVHVARMTTVPSPGQVGRITYPRYGLDSGKQVLVRRVEHNPATGAVALTLWG